jgi:predicted ester cyclase
MLRVVLFVPLLLLALTAGLTRGPWELVRAQEATSGTACPVLSEEENAAVARRFIDDALSEHNASMLKEIMAPDVAYHAAAGVDVGTVDEVIPLVGATINGFPDVHYTIDKTISEDDLVAFVWHAEGTNSGKFQGRAPTGKHAAWTGINAFRLACGRIVEGWTEIDALGRLQQIGVLAMPTSANAAPPTTAQEATPAAACAATSEDENEAIARRWNEDALNGADLTVLDEILSVDVVLHSGMIANMQGVEGIKGMLGSVLTGFPDVHYTIDEAITQGDSAVLIWRAEGTQTGEFQGYPPSGKHATWTGINVYRFECGRVAEVWAEFIALSRLQQIGAVATPTP